MNLGFAKDHGTQLFYDVLFKHWGVRLRKAKPSKALMIDNPADVKQEEQDLQRALRGDECDEADTEVVVVLDDPYLDGMFVDDDSPVQDEEKANPVSDDKPTSDEKPASDDQQFAEVNAAPATQNYDDAVVCSSADSSLVLAQLNLRIMQIQLLDK